MTPEEIEAHFKYWEDQPKYKELKKSLYEKAKAQYKALTLKESEILDLGIHNLPLGYVGIRHKLGSLNEYVYSYRTVYEYQWIDFEGSISERFTDKWDVYHDAMDRLYPWNSFTDEERELIRKYDHHLNTKTSTRPIKGAYGIKVGKMQSHKGQSDI